MGNEVATMQSLQDRVTERIRATFVDLVPEDQWRALVAKAVADYFEDRKPAHAFAGAVPSPTPFKQLVHAELTEFFRTRLRDYLHGDEFFSEWGARGMTPSDGAKRIIRECIPDVVEALLAGAVQRVIEAARSGL